MFKILKNFSSPLTQQEKIGFIFCAVFIFVLRFDYLTKIVIDWDESVYWVVSQNMLQGDILYKEIWDNKGPLLYFLFMPVIYFFGANIIALRIFTTLYLILSMFFVLLLAKKMFSGKNHIFSPLIYGVFFSLHDFGGLASNSELFMMLPIILGIYFFYRYLESGSADKKSIFISGFLAGCCFMIKPTGLFTLLAIPAYVLIKDIFSKEMHKTLFIKTFFWYCLGFSALMSLILIYLLANQSVRDFYHAFVFFNSEMVDRFYITKSLDRLKHFYSTAITQEIFTILSILSLLLVFVSKKIFTEDRKSVFLSFLIFLFSTVGFISARFVYPHYYLQMSLAFALIIPMGLSSLKINIESKHITKFWIISISCVLFFLVLYKIPKFPDQYQGMKKNLYFAVADYIKKNTKETDTIFILGGQPIIYFLAERDSSTKYFFWIHHYGLWGKILKNSYAVNEDLEKNMPKYFIFKSSQYFSKKGKNPPIKSVEKLIGFMKENYREEARFHDYKIFSRKKISAEISQ